MRDLGVGVCVVVVSVFGQFSLLTGQFFFFYMKRQSSCWFLEKTVKASNMAKPDVIKLHRKGMLVLQKCK